MQMFEAEKALLIAIHEGRSVVEGADASTLKMLMRRRFVIGVDGRLGDYFNVELTPIGREVLAGVFRQV